MSSSSSKPETKKKLLSLDSASLVDLKAEVGVQRNVLSFDPSLTNSKMPIPGVQEGTRGQIQPEARRAQQDQQQGEEGGQVEPEEPGSATGMSLKFQVSLNEFYKLYSCKIKLILQRSVRDADQIEKEEEARRQLEKKAEMYDRLQREDGEDDRFLVDFGRS